MTMRKRMFLSGVSNVRHFCFWFSQSQFFSQFERRVILAKTLLPRQCSKQPGQPSARFKAQ